MGEIVKKMLLLSFIFWCLISRPVEAKENELKFQIIYDSTESNYVEVKNEILKVISETLYQVDVESYAALLSGDLSFLANEGREVYFQNNRLIFRLGDGKGKLIQGDLFSNRFCMVEVKPKSLIKKWFDF